jgi:hypothetical protein
MGLCSLLTKLYKLIRFFDGQGIQVDPIDRLIKMDCGSA